MTTLYASALCASINYARVERQREMTRGRHLERDGDNDVHLARLADTSRRHLDNTSQRHWGAIGDESFARNTCHGVEEHRGTHT
jgi:hypothetical protein